MHCDGSRDFFHVLPLTLSLSTSVHSVSIPTGEHSAMAREKIILVKASQARGERCKQSAGPEIMS